MAKVLEVYPGKDNIVRVVQAKTQSGEIVRPVRRIYPLEIKCTVDESHSSGKLLTARSGRTVKEALQLFYDLPSDNESVDSENSCDEDYMPQPLEYTSD
ncbi:hypothetical protein TNCT_183491 [Trichonephila clavata]|uniref:DUF5641 domain-containing protein n=1 Tax=Trichonephila clavata TaxID=2740835 RepID=A0A8X6FEV7_TRICU|nr:hypothetical protein TNCT_183491 [Trichonephila clavata]